MKKKGNRGGTLMQFRGWALGIFAALCLGRTALAEEPDRRPPPPEISAIQATEMEARQALPAPRSVEVPILVYHHVVPGRTTGSALTRALFVTPEAFDQQLKYLQDNGYQSVSFTDLADCLEYGALLPERAVILTFDDGWENQFQYGFPLLQKYGFSGTFYVVTGYIDHPNFMTAGQLRTMAAAGMAIGSHTRSHPPLPSLGDGQRLRDEIAGSKKWLEQQLGITVDTFAYPYGSYTAAVVAATKAAGYRTARTVDSGTHDTADNMETLPGIIFPDFLNRFRTAVELAASEPRR
jgi:peptidoglycan/xylan/chitin deacetylase (PgdA/CDA1 family)